MMTDAITTMRLTMYTNGYQPVPVSSPDVPVPMAGKRPLLEKWETRCAVADDIAIEKYIQDLPTSTNTGILCGNVVGVDIDVPVGELAQKVEALAVSVFGQSTLTRIGRAPKSLHVFRTERRFEKISTPALRLRDGETWEKSTKVKVEVLANGQQFVAFGVHPETRAPFTWPGESPLTTPFSSLLEVTEDQCRTFIEQAERILRNAGAITQRERKALDEPTSQPTPRITKKPRPPLPGGRQMSRERREAWVRAAFDAEIKALAEAGDGERNDQCNKCGFALYGLVKTGWLRRGDVDARIRQAMVDNGYAASDGWNAIEATLKSAWDDATPREPPEFEDELKHARPALDRAGTVGRHSDGGEVVELAESAELFLSNALVREFNGRVRHVKQWGAFLLWDGTVWRKDDRREVHTAAREIVERASLAADKPAVAKAIATRKTVAGVIGLTEIHADVAASDTLWDTNDWILNTPGGVVDLTTGALREGDPLEYCTKITAVAPAEHVPDDCLWLRVLDRVCAPGVANYLKRIAGYSLTGSTREEAFFFGHGTGANGKSKVFGAISGVMGTYHVVAAPDTFTATKYKEHPTELAMLRGARLVTAHETEEGRSWSEARIKQITGGDKITARFMGENYFEFRPGFKLLIVSNHKPRLRNVDYAMRRRINFIPFGVQIPEAERDADLENKLKAEWPFILRWAIDGCLEWQREGLNPPPAVMEATNDYLSDEDSVGQWLAERCEILRGHRETSRRLWESWKLWAEANDPHNVGSQKRLAGKLESHKLIPYRSGKNRGFVGVRVLE